MTSIVPQPDYRRTACSRSHRTQARCAQHEASTVGVIEPDPARASTRRKCPLEKSSTSPDSAHAAHRAVGPRADLSWRFPSGAAVAKQLPIRALPVDLGGAATLILAVVPFEQSRSISATAPKPASSQVRVARCNGLVNTLAKVSSTQPFREPAGIALATFCQRQVGKSRVLARERPRGFPVPGEVNDRQHFVHTFTRFLRCDHPKDGFWY